MNKNMTLHMIGNAHIDPVWLWRWQEGYQTVWATFRSALDRMNETDGFIFTCAQAQVYKWMEKADPDMFEEIKKRVKEGRWCIVGGWWMQPDCNIPSGESFARHALYSQRYFYEKFGVMAKVGYNVDSFGHNGMLPQLLSKSGMDNYVFMRPGPHEKGLPDVFWWQSIDGSRVLTYRIPFGYGISDRIEEVAEKISDMCNVDNNINDMMMFYGVGNHGGGPTKEVLKTIQKMMQDDNMPKIIFSDPNKYFDKIRNLNIDLPVVKDDLQHHASGCYSVNGFIKAMNRKAEQHLITAEIIGTLAGTYLNKPYDKDRLKSAWQDILFNQFHDIMAGTSVKEAYDDALSSLGSAIKSAEEELNESVNAFLRQIDTTGEGLPVVVFNQLSWMRKMPVVVEFQGSSYENDKPTMAIYDDGGNNVPCQVVRTSAVVGRWRTRLLFIADVPAFGYRVYRIRFNTSMNEQTELKIDLHSLENRFLKVHLNDSGEIDSILDKRSNAEVLKESAKALVIEDKSDTWSHGVFYFRDEIGAFKGYEVKVVESGPVRACIRVKSRYESSTIIQDIMLYNDFDRVFIKTKVDWHEHFKMLKMSFTVNVENPKAYYDIPYGYIERPANGEEEPGGEWIDVTGTNKNGEYGLTISTDSKYSYDILNDNMRVTVLRSPIFAQHDPNMPDEGEDYEFTDQGEQEFNMVLYPHKGTWQDVDSVKTARELNSPLVLSVDTWHDGKLPQKLSLIDVDKANIEVSAMKTAEDGDGIIIRCHENTGKETEAKIFYKPQNATIKAKFKPCEIKTFKINLSGVKETNLLEM